MKIESWISPTVISVLYTVLIFVLLCAAVAWTMLTGSDTKYSDNRVLLTISLQIEQAFVLLIDIESIDVAR